MANNKEHNLPSAKIGLCLRVLGYKIDDEPWAAHCLETDIVGHGVTFEAAVKDLMELTEVQVSFAIYKNQPALLNRPAPLWVIETYNNLFQASLQQFFANQKPDASRRVASIPLHYNQSNSNFAIAQA